MSAALDLDALPASAVVSRRAAAEALGVSLRTLDGWRSAGKGPAAIRLSERCVRYRVGALRDFLSDHEK